MSIAPVRSRGGPLVSKLFYIFCMAKGIKPLANIGGTLPKFLAFRLLKPRRLITLRANSVSSSQKLLK